MTSVVVTALCDQPEAFASDLGDDQSRYLLLYGCGFITDRWRRGLSLNGWTKFAPFLIYTWIFKKFRRTPMENTASAHSLISTEQIGLRSFLPGIPAIGSETAMLTMNENNQVRNQHVRLCWLWTVTRLSLDRTVIKRCKIKAFWRPLK